MLVEDNKVNVKMMVMLLSKLGWTLSTKTNSNNSNGDGSDADMSGNLVVAHNGVRCLEIIERAFKSGKKEALPLVFLMDQQMDDMDGVECTQRIRSDYDSRYTSLGLSAPYIIACTANASRESRQQCLAARMDAFLPKPLNLEALVEALKRAGQHVFGK